MKFVADESVDFSIVKALRSNGMEVFAVAEQEPSVADEDVLALAVRHDAPLLTEDKDFGELVFRLRLPHCGVILLRLGHLTGEAKGPLTAAVILTHLSELPGAFAVFDGYHLRIRPPA